MSNIEKLKSQIKEGTYDWDSAIDNLAEIMVSMMKDNSTIINKGDKND